MTNPNSSIPPTNSKPDPAAALSNEIKNLRTTLNNIGVDASIADSVLQGVQDRLTANKAAASTVNGDYGSILQSLSFMGVDFTPAENALNKYASYTYHLKFCMTSDVEARNIQSYDDFRNSSHEVIAESGVTVGFNIRDFELKNYAAPNQKTGIAPEIDWKMSIVEPYGLSFVDRLLTLANSMGVVNHLQAKYFIELWFNGYDDAGNPSGTEIYKLYRVQIQELSTDSSSSGSVHNLKGVVDGTMAHSNAFALTPSNITVNNVSTFGQFWEAFKIQLNDASKNLDYNQPTPRVEYNFELPNEWKSWKVYRTPNDNISQSGFTVTGFETPTITIPRGKGLQEILIMVMSMTKEGRDFTMGPPAAGSGSTTTREEAEGVSLIPLIRSKVEFLSYNYFFNSYYIKITYYFKKYPTVHSYKSRDFINNSQKEDVQKARLKSFISSDRLRKVYNYQFTGLNTDVLKFDIHLDNYWQASQPIYDGYNNSTIWSLPPNVSGESVPQTVISGYKKAKAELQRARANLAAIEGSNPVGKITATLQNAQQQVKTALENVKTWTDKINLQDFEIKFGTGSPGEKSIAGIIVNNPNLFTDPRIRQDIITRISYEIRRKDAKDRYLETVVPQDPRSTQPLPISTQISNSPIQQNNSTGGLQQADPTVTNSSGGFVSPPKSRGLLASIINNVVGGPFVKINLEIRGDPYWIGIDNIQELPTLNPNTSTPRWMRKNSAVFHAGECAFLLFFRTGEEPDEQTGIVNFTQTSWAFNGLYTVTCVTNTFKDGKFTQVLEARKDVALYSVWKSVTQADLVKAGMAPV